MMMKKIVIVIVSLTCAFLFANESIHADGKRLYEQKCFSCHGKDGKGNPAMTKPLKVDLAALDINKPGTVNKSDPALLKIINDGKGRMPGYSGSMSPEQQKAVLDYMRSLK